MELAEASKEAKGLFGGGGKGGSGPAAGEGTETAAAAAAATVTVTAEKRRKLDSPVPADDAGQPHAPGVLEPVGINLPILTEGPSVLEIIRLNMDGVEARFEQIKVPSGGSTTFEIPAEGGDTTPAKELVGVILEHYRCNSYWKGREVSNLPPDCSALDARTGRGNPGGACATCPKNQWGSAINKDGTPGRGKACKNMRRLYLLTENELFPFLFTVPPTGLKEAAMYFQRLTSKRRKPFYAVVTRIKAVAATSADGQPFARPVLSVVSELPPRAALSIRSYREMLLEAMRERAITADEYHMGDDAAPDDAAGGDDDGQPF